MESKRTINTKPSMSIDLSMFGWLCGCIVYVAIMYPLTCHATVVISRMIWNKRSNECATQLEMLWIWGSLVGRLINNYFRNVCNLIILHCGWEKSFYGRIYTMTSVLYISQRRKDWRNGRVTEKNSTPDENLKRHKIKFWSFYWNKRVWRGIFSANGTPIVSLTQTSLDRRGMSKSFPKKEKRKKEIE